MRNELRGHTVKLSQSSALFDYNRYSRVSRYVWCMARLLLIMRAKSFTAAKTQNICPELLDTARQFVMRDVQRASEMEKDLQNTSEINSKGKYSRLHPVRNELGIWIVGTRLLRNNPMAVDPSTLPILLPSDHPLTLTLVREAHIASGHRGRDITLAKFRQDYWCTNGLKLAKKVVNNCQKCCLRDAKFLQQQMGVLPRERVSPGPPFNCVMVDFFGPYLIRGEVE